MGIIFDQKCDQKLESVLIETPIGGMDITYCPNGLHLLSRLEQTFQPNLQIKVQTKDPNFVSNNKWINECIDWLTIYFSNNRQHIERQLKAKTPDICPNVTQSEFYRKVWSTLMTEITFGQTVSYSQLAVMAGNGSASRAVGSAMKKNPWILLIPCHRVLKKDGSIGNYSSGGQTVKDWLLSYEKGLSDK